MADPRKNIPNQQWIDQQWLSWYRDLKSYVSKKDANEIFLAFWQKRGGSGANTSTLRETLKKEDLTIEANTIFGSAKDKALDFGDSIGRIFGIGKWVVAGVGVMVLIPVIMLLFNVAKNPVGTMNSAAKLKGGM